jgi:tritrans,polycis-undecaprenyl-diphosphate synthase [geranylgeranyl-diphosphate specific]
MHLGIIPDGNRRYAMKNNMSNIEAYYLGFNLIINIIKEFFYNKENIIENYANVKLININQITIYVCSVENLEKRDKQDVSNIYQLIEKFISYYNEYKKEFIENKISINIIGNFKYIENIYLEKLINIMKETDIYKSKYKLNLAIAYSGRDEIINMTNKIMILNKLTEIDEKEIYDNMYLKNDIDIIIRTGYEKRTSNFFPWQSIYSEWFFIDKYWPELNIIDIINIIEEFNNRKRRFGK